MKRLMTLLCLFLCATAISVGANSHGITKSLNNKQLSIQNLERAMQLVDSVMNRCFTGTTELKMMDVYNLSTHSYEAGTADVWPYTAVIEAVNSILEGLDGLKKSAPKLYKKHHNRYITLLKRLHDSAAFYRGTFTLTSYTRTTTWHGIYGVHRGSHKEAAVVAGIENVYDDQMWIVREYIRAYKNTGDEAFLTEAEHLTDYILDGWDACLDSIGHEYGGITWGPGYTSKHACSNSPFISPLVWLSSLYEGKPDGTTHYYILSNGTRATETVNKHDYYLNFAKRLYEWQRNTLRDSTTGCYHDMCGGVTGKITFDEVDGKKYRKHVDLKSPNGTQFTYNTGTMLAGAVDLYLATNDRYYLDEVLDLSYHSYEHFKGTSRLINGKEYYPFPLDSNTLRGFNPWFNNVLLRAYVDAAMLPSVVTGSAKGANYPIIGCETFQQNLDHAYANYLTDGFLPNDLLGGWGENTKTKAFHQVAFAAVYAKLAQLYLTAK